MSRNERRTEDADLFLALHYDTSLLTDLDAKIRPCTKELVEEIANRQCKSPLLRDYEIATPTLQEVESAAWESGLWELAYRIAAPADGL